jgi:hypothetical protein
MQLQRFSLIILTLVIVACSAPNDAQMGQESTASVEQNEAVIRQVLALIDVSTIVHFR